MCFLVCHTLVVMVLILMTIISWTVAVRTALTDRSTITSSMYPSASPTMTDKVALRIELFMATLWLSFLGLLSLGVAAASLSFGPKERDRTEHYKIV